MKLSNISEVEKKLANVPPTHLIRLIYISDIYTTNDSVFEHIQRHSNIYNKDNNITGFLCNDAKSFLQYLEGTKDVVLSLMARIFVDINHTNVRVVLTKPVDKHIFTDWRMHSLNLDGSSWRYQVDYSDMKEFIPFDPQIWQPWFIESFIGSMRQFDNAYNSNLVTFDSIGLRELELTLSKDSRLLWFFFAFLTSTSLAITLINYTALPN